MGKAELLTLILYYLTTIAIGNELTPVEYLRLRETILEAGYDPSMFDEKTLLEVIKFFCKELANS